MYAIIKTGGKQYRVEPGTEIKIEKLKGKNEGEEVEFDCVLMIRNEDDIAIGQPFLEEAVVQGEILENDRDEKITVFKYKKRKGQRTKLGHRQPYMKVRIEDIDY